MLSLFSLMSWHSNTTATSHLPGPRIFNTEVPDALSGLALNRPSSCIKAGDTLPVATHPERASSQGGRVRKHQSAKGEFLFRSILTKYNGERGGDDDFVYSRNWAKRDSAVQPYVGSVQLLQASVGKLYYMAYADTIGTSVFTRYITGIDYPDTLKYPLATDHYGKYWRWNIIQLKDSSLFVPNFKTLDNLYNYSLIVPDGRGSAAFLQKAMQNDLDNYFGYHAEVRDSLMPYYALECSGPCQLQAKNPGQSFTAVEVPGGFRYASTLMKDILVRLLIPFSATGASYDFQPFTTAPFIDETGFTAKIDYNITNVENDAIQKGDWSAAMSFLDRLGLKLVLRYRLTKVVVISDQK